MSLSSLQLNGTLGNLGRHCVDTVWTLVGFDVEFALKDNPKR